MTMYRRALGMIAAALLASACAPPRAPLLRQDCYDADAQLSAALDPLEENRALGCGAKDAAGRSYECEAHRREIERLAMVCPGHVPTLMANAVLAYDARQAARAQQFLDQIFEQRAARPDAAVLRARIAIDEGNLPFARRFLDQQIRLSPDHAGLREALGATLYLSGRMADAQRELTAAADLGAPRWRIAYHLGLIEEAAGRTEDAKRFYAEAVAGNPDFAPAQARLKGLGRGAK
jgi:tetratricopeptide (TPR) repeat protein